MTTPTAPKLTTLRAEFAAIRSMEGGFATATITVTVARLDDGTSEYRVKTNGTRRAQDAAIADVLRRQGLVVIDTDVEGGRWDWREVLVCGVASEGATPCAKWLAKHPA